MKLTEALLYFIRLDQLQDLCQKTGIHAGTDAGSMASLAASYLLQPHVMKERMRVLHDDDIRFMEIAVNNGRVVPAKANYDSADRLMGLFYGFITGSDRAFEVPEDAALVFKTINTSEFETERYLYSWISDCLGLVPYLYGMMETEYFCRFCRKRKQLSLTDDEILQIADDLIENNPCPVHRDDNMLIRNGLEESGMMEKLSAIHAGTEPFLPTYSEIKDLLQNHWPSHTSSWQKLYNWLMHKYRNDEKAGFIIETAWLSIASAATFSQINSTIKEDEPNLDSQNAEWQELLTQCWMDTRMMLCNGYTPREAGLDASRIFLH